MDMKDLDRIFGAFRFGTIQSCVQLKRIMDQHSVTWEEFEAWVKDVAPRIDNTIRPKDRKSDVPVGVAIDRKKRKGCGGCGKSGNPTILHPCKDCDTRMILHSVNDSPCTQVGGSLTRQWICPKCGREDFE